MDLADCLAALGFERHPLMRSALGHFHVAGQLSGEVVDVLVDTGAASTVVDLDYCRTRGLPVEETGLHGGGAGGVHLPIFRLSGATLELSGTPLHADGLYALDLTHVNKGLTQKGGSSVQAILGADVLTHHRAVIDYAASALYLIRRLAGDAPR